MIDKILAARILERPIEQINLALGDDDWSVQDALYLLERKLAPRPTMGRMNALRAELVGNGHSLARHGPQIDNEALIERLTTGVVGGVFAPADKGYATSFTSALTYNLSRINAVNKLSAAYQKTVEVLSPLIKNFDDAITALKGITAQSAAYGVAVKKATDERKKLLTAATGLSVVGLKTDDACTKMPVALAPSAGKKPVSVDDTGIGLIKFSEGVSLVIVNECVIGRGVKASDINASQPIVNPKYSAGKPGKIWTKDLLADMDPILNTYTRFNPPALDFSLVADPKTWAMPQHFPDNGGPGWRG